MKFRLLSLISIAAIGQIVNTLPATADSTQIDRLTIQPKLASSLTKSTLTTEVLPTAKDLIARAKRKTRKQIRRTPAKTPATVAPSVDQPTSQSPETTPATTEKKVLVSDIIIKTPQGALEPELESRIRQVLTVKTGQPTTRTQLEQNLNAIRALGSFSTVEIVPEDTSKGVRLSFVVTPYGNLRQVQIKTLPDSSRTVLKQSEIDQIFQPQYGKKLNAVELQAAIKKLNELYQKQGYNLAQVVDVKELSADGTLELIIAEGMIEDVQVRFMTKDGQLVDDKKQPIRGNTRPFIVTREAELKAGSILNRATIERDLRRIYGLGIFDDVRVSFAPGTDPAKVILQFNVIEKKTSSIVAGGGISSTNGLFASLSYNQLNVGGNAQTLSTNVQLGTQGLLGDISFTDPWIATDPNGTSYTASIFSQRSQSTIFGGGTTPQYVPNSIDTANGFTTGDTPVVLRTGAGITFSRPLDGNPLGNSPWRGSLGVKYQRVALQDIYGGNGIPIGTNVPKIGNQDLTFSKTGQDDLVMVQLGLTQDLRNNFGDPTQGSLFNLGLDQTAPIGLGNIFMSRARASFTQYVPVQLVNFTPGSQSLKFNVQGGTILGDLPPYEAFALGGPTSVRGFQPGDVGTGRSYVQASAEYRFPIVSIVGGEIFIDGASDLGTGSSVPGNPAGLRGKPGSGIGYGAGIRLNVPSFGAIRIDYAINSQGGNAVQFGIGENF